jgi:hypothetical protein
METGTPFVETITSRNKDTPTVETATDTPTVETGAIITTRYIGPTNHKPGRIRATSGSGKSAAYSWDHSIGIFENHAAAAKALAGKLGITGRRIVGGGMAGSGYAFAFVS